MKPIVLADFQDLLVPLTEDELEALTASIMAEGCRDALVVWKGEGLLLDGHNRLAICEARGLPYETREIELPDRDAAKVWIIDNQLARRNLIAVQRIALVEKKRGILEEQARRNREATSKDAPRDEHGHLQPVRQNLASPDADARKVDAKLAEAAGVSRETVRKHKVIQKEGTPEVKAAVASGKMSIDAAYRETRHLGPKRPRIDPKNSAPGVVYKEPEWFASGVEDACRKIKQRYRATNRKVAVGPEYIRRAVSALEKCASYLGGTIDE